METNTETKVNAATLDGLLALDNEVFVTAAYQMLLGRDPDPGGMAVYLAQLRAGTGKLRILAQLRVSAEGKAYAAKLPGLDTAVQRHQRERLPVVGWLFRAPGRPNNGRAMNAGHSSGARSLEQFAPFAWQGRLSGWTRRIERRFGRINRLFLLAVVVPTLVSALYYGLIASDVYISESHFVVRSPQRQTPTGLGALFTCAGFARSQDDAYTVHDFMRSRDALRKLNQELSLDKAFGSSDVDRFSRFAGLTFDNSFEALHRYYQKHLAINLDTASSIAELKVMAFTPEDAFRINEMLLQMGEQLINKLNERGRQDMIRFAMTEVESAEQSAKAAALALSRYRTRNTIFDPERQSSLQLQQISKLQDELMATQAQLEQVRTFTPDNPQIPALEKRVETLQRDIKTETAKVAGGNSSLTSKAAEYERLSLERAFADKQLAGALASLEQARNDAQRKQLYLERIVQPSRPDVAIEPRRFRNVFATFLFGLVLWGILTILVAGIREHHD